MRFYRGRSFLLDACCPYLVGCPWLPCSVALCPTRRMSGLGSLPLLELEDGGRLLRSSRPPCSVSPHAPARFTWRIGVDSRALASSSRLIREFRRLDWPCLQAIWTRIRQPSKTRTVQLLAQNNDCCGLAELPLRATRLGQRRRRQRTRFKGQCRRHSHSEATADVELRKKTCLGRLSLRLLQPQVRRAYLNRRVQIFIAVMIAGNFVSNVVEKQIDPWGDKFPDEWYLIETAWNVLFILELIWNMWGCFYLSQWNGHFLSSPWNLFDLSIVALSIPPSCASSLATYLASSGC